MTRSRRTDPVPSTSSRPPAKTPEERENQLIMAATDLAEQQLKSGTASAQVIAHYLKLGSSRERLEQERLKNENKLLATKREVMESQKKVEELITDALRAMQAYSGNAPDNSNGDFDEFQD